MLTHSASLYFNLPSPALPCLTLPYLALPYLTLPCPVLPYPALSYLSLPCHALPYLASRFPTFLSTSLPVRLLWGVPGVQGRGIQAHHLLPLALALFIHCYISSLSVLTQYPALLCSQRQAAWMRSGREGRVQARSSITLFPLCQSCCAFPSRALFVLRIRAWDYNKHVRLSYATKEIYSCLLIYMNNLLINQSIKQSMNYLSVYRSICLSTSLLSIYLSIYLSSSLYVNLRVYYALSQRSGGHLFT